MTTFLVATSFAMDDSLDLNACPAVVRSGTIIDFLCGERTEIDHGADSLLCNRRKNVEVILMAYSQYCGGGNIRLEVQLQPVSNNNQTLSSHTLFVRLGSRL